MRRLLLAQGGTSLLTLCTTCSLAESCGARALEAPLRADASRLVALASAFWNAAPAPGPRAIETAAQLRARSGLFGRVVLPTQQNCSPGGKTSNPESFFLTKRNLLCRSVAFFRFAWRAGLWRTPTLQISHGVRDAQQSTSRVVEVGLALCFYVVLVFA